MGQVLKGISENGCIYITLERIMLILNILFIKSIVNHIKPSLDYGYFLLYEIIEIEFSET